MFKQSKIRPIRAFKTEVALEVPLKLKTVTPWAPVGAKIKYVLLCSVAQWRDIAYHRDQRLWRPGGDKLVLLETDIRRDGEVNIVHIVVHWFMEKREIMEVDYKHYFDIFRC